MNMEELYQKHKPLICWVAKHYQWALERDPSLDMDDLLQAGYIGLQTAAETYDSSRGTWSTWAVPCIRGEIQSAAGRRKTETPLSLDGAYYTSSEGESFALLDHLPAAVDIEEAVTEVHRKAALRETVQTCLETLVSKQSREAIRRVDYAQQTMKQAAEAMGCTEYEVRAARDKALHRLKRAPALLPYREEVRERTRDARTNWMLGGSLSAFRQQGESGVERLVWQREQTVQPGRASSRNT